MSPDPVDRHAAFVESLALPYRLLADTDKAVCERYGVLKEANRLGVKSRSVRRSTFVVGEDGRLQECMYGVNAIGHAEEVVACVRENA